MNEVQHPGFDKPEEYETFTTTNDLEEAAKKHSCYDEDCEGAWYEPIVRNAFIAGAKWQADHTPLPEDTVIYQKGVAEGKRLMMEEAVEIGTTEIYWEPDGDRAFPTFDPPVEDLLMPDIISQRFNDGDKVRVIICKKED